MTNQSVKESLSKVLADTYALYLKTQNYHWNVTGANFHSLHAMFEEQYRDLAEAADELAERIRALGDKVPAAFSVFNKLTDIKDGNENANAGAMVKELAEDQQKVIKSLETALKAAQNEGDEVTIGMVAERMQVHQKAAWMLRSSC